MFFIKFKSPDQATIFKKNKCSSTIKFKNIMVWYFHALSENEKKKIFELFIIHN